MSTAASEQVVTFRLGEDYFAADIFTVERVLRYRQPTAIPHLPEWIDGVIDHEGRVVPVIDLARRFGLARIEPRLETRIIVFHIGEEWIGTVVDAVLEVASLDPRDVAPAPLLFRGLSAAFLRGLLKRGDRLMIFLDISQVLTTTERMELTQMAAEPYYG